jgi:hypothetical protein
MLTSGDIVYGNGFDLTIVVASATGLARRPQGAFLTDLSDPSRCLQEGSVVFTGDDVVYNDIATFILRTVAASAGNPPDADAIRCWNAVMDGAEDCVDVPPTDPGTRAVVRIWTIAVAGAGPAHLAIRATTAAELPDPGSLVVLTLRGLVAAALTAATSPHRRSRRRTWPAPGRPGRSNSS